MTNDTQPTPDESSTAQCSGSRMGLGIAIGSGLGTSLGISLGLVFDNLLIGLAIGSGVGTSLGVSFASLLDAQAKARAEAATGERDGCSDPDKSSTR
jgi:hypothetical protein